MEVPKFNTQMIDSLAAAETGECLVIKQPAELMNVEQPEEPVDLEELFFQLLATNSEIEDRVRFIDETIKTLSEKRMELVKDLVSEAVELENTIEKEILKHGKSFKCVHGAATFRKAYERTSWDSKKLEGMALMIPEIEECKKTTIVEPSVSVKVGWQA